MVQLSHPYMTTGKPINLTRWTFVSKVMSLLFNMLSRLVRDFLPGSKCLLISWLQSLSAVILEHKKIKSVSLFPLFSHLFVMKWQDQIPWSLFFECWVLSQLFHSPLSLSPRGSLFPFHFLLVTTSHGLNDLKNRHLSLTVLEVAESRIKVLVDSVPGEVPLPTCRCHLLTMFLHSKERKQAMVSLLFLIRT